MLVTLLQIEAELVLLTVQGIFGGTVSGDKHLRSILMDVILFDTWDWYDNYDIVTEDFPRQVGEIYNAQFVVYIFKCDSVIFHLSLYCARGFLPYTAAPGGIGFVKSVMVKNSAVYVVVKLTLHN